MPEQHAPLAPSAAHRWLSCPGSIRLVQQLPSEDQDTSNEFSREGTAAHKAAELLASYQLGSIDIDELMEKLAKWTAESSEFDTDEILMYAEEWAELAGTQKAHGMTVLLERQVDTRAPQCWGTSDMVVFNEEFLEIRDFKYGKGVRVFAEHNEQLMLYAVGALETFAPSAKKVALSIHQPRIDHFDTALMSADDLRQWRDAVAVPGARLALTHDSPIVPSEEACRFCPAAGVCVARTESVLSLDFGAPEIMSSEQLAETMEKLDAIEHWAESVRKASVQAAKRGNLPGWKIVRKAGRRQIVDDEAVIKLLGERAVRHSLRPLGELEKLVGGKAKLTERLGGLIQLSTGSEVLVPEEDPRPAVGPADEFKET